MTEETGVALAIGLVSSSVDSLRSELSAGLAAISTRLDGKMDKSDGVAITQRLDRMEAETERTEKQTDSRLRQLEDAQTRQDGSNLRHEADQRRRGTTREKIAAGFGTAYVGGMPLVVWLLSRHG